MNAPNDKITIDLRLKKEPIKLFGFIPFGNRIVSNIYYSHPHGWGKGGSSSGSLENTISNFLVDLQVNSVDQPQAKYPVEVRLHINDKNKLLYDKLTCKSLLEIYAQSRGTQITFVEKTQ